MSKRKSSDKKSRPAARKREDREQTPSEGQSSENSPASRVPSQAAIRETIESVVIAFVLAFLFRTFEAEAFVIPTGSMATTLMGRHKDVSCPVCGSRYQVSASDEVDSNGASRGPGAQVVEGTCPMCRFSADFGPGNPEKRRYPSYKGDRILVGKFSYQFGDPQPWDVAVFKYPGGAMTNYIKRLVGLPNQTIQIKHGDIFVKSKGEEEFTISRKPTKKLLAMLQPVFDNDVTPQLLEHGWKPRWRPVASHHGDSSAGDWEPAEDHASFQTSGEGAGEKWLHYQHRVPTYEQWLKLNEGSLGSDEPLPQLISDFSAYNTGRSRSESAPDTDAYGLHWVGDLAVRCILEATSDSGEALLELIEGGRRFQCRIDVATGRATLGIDGLDDYRPAATTKVLTGGKHRILFANVDDQLRLLVEGREIKFDAPTTYGSLDGTPSDNTVPTRDDLSPVRIGTKGAGLRITRIEILRDIYYIAEGRRSYATPGPITDFKAMDMDTRRDLLVNPELREGYFDRDNQQLKDPPEFELGPDQFLALGDNSAKSKDGRLWEQDGFEYYVSRELLIGKALFIYWPHSWNRIPGTKIPFPFFPNFQNMGFVR